MAGMYCTSVICFPEINQAQMRVCVYGLALFSSPSLLRVNPLFQPMRQIPCGYSIPSALCDLSRWCAFTTAWLPSRCAGGKETVVIQALLFEPVDESVALGFT